MSAAQTKVCNCSTIIFSRRTHGSFRKQVFAVYLRALENPGYRYQEPCEDSMTGITHLDDAIVEAHLVASQNLLLDHCVIQVMAETRQRRRKSPALGIETTTRSSTSRGCHAFVTRKRFDRFEFPFVFHSHRHSLSTSRLFDSYRYSYLSVLQNTRKHDSIRKKKRTLIRD